MVPVFAALLIAGFWLYPRQKMDHARLDLPNGFKAAYVVSYKSEGSGSTSLAFLNPNATPSLDRKVSISLDALLLFNLLSRDEGTFNFAFALRPLANQTVSSDSLKGPIEGLFTLSQWGEITSFQLPDDRYLQSVTIVADILNLISMDLKNKSGSERSFAGPIAVSWALEGGNDSQLLLKKTYMADGKGSSQMSGEIVFNLNTRTYLSGVSGTRERKVYQSGNLMSEDVTEFKLSRDDSKVEADIPVPTSLVRETMDGTVFRKKQEEQMARDTLGGANQESLMDELKQIDPNDLKSSKDVYLRVKAHILLYPDLVHNWLPFLMDFSYGDLRCSHVATALTAIGNEASQRLLVEAIKNADEDPVKRERLIPHLSFTDQPSQETENFLKHLADSDENPRVRGAARLAQGTVGHQLRDSSPERSEAILKDWARKLQSADDPKERDNAIRVIGNIGLPQQYSLIEPYLTHPDPHVRVQAVNALRFVDTSESVASLVAALTTDSDQNVRIMASQSLGFLPYRPELIEVYEKIMFTEHQMTILSNVLKNLGNMGQRDPRAIEVLKKFSAACGKTELCQQADGILSTLTR